METIINYYKLCTVAAGGRAHAVINLPPADKKQLALPQFIAADGTVAEHVVGGSAPVHRPFMHHAPARIHAVVI